MLNNYTQFIENHLDSIQPDEFDTDDISELDILIKEYSRTFSDGLSELLLQTGYKGELNDTKEKRKYIYSHLCKIGKETDESIKKNFRNWLDGKKVPDQASREIIFELCFALSASLETVQWFFNHVYFYRAFNCHDIKEAVYYYCFKNNHDYFYAQSLIQEIEKYPISTESIPTNNPYTWEIRNDINEFKTVEELKSYFKKNRHFFSGHYNQTAKQFIAHFVNEIQGKPEARNTVNFILKKPKRYKKTNEVAPEKFVEHDIQKCGLIVYEKFAYIHENILDDSNLNDVEIEDINNSIQNVDLTSISFMLNNIFSSTICKENLENLLSKKVSQNFPSEKTLSNLLNSINTKNNIDTTTNYDSIRKCLILLKFYHFWCKVKIGIEKSLYEENNLYDVYIYETNDMLLDCGYDDLFPGNIYDRLFMYCAKRNDPLSAFRKFISQTAPSTK